MNNDMIIKKTNVWGQFHNVKNVDKRTRLMKKQQLISGKGGYPFIDHYTIYTYKPKHQKGQSKEEQSFILSYAYNYDAFADENVFSGAKAVAYLLHRRGNKFLSLLITVSGPLGRIGYKWVARNRSSAPVKLLSRLLKP